MTVPEDTPLTTPSSEPTVAIPPDIGDQTPPDTVSVSNAVAPTQTPSGPVIALGDKLTVIVLVTVQPPHVLYVISVVPVAFPRTMPVLLPIAATDGLLLLHVPHNTVSVSVIVAPT